MFGIIISGGIPMLGIITVPECIHSESFHNKYIAIEIMGGGSRRGGVTLSIFPSLYI